VNKTIVKQNYSVSGPPASKMVEDSFLPYRTLRLERSLYPRTSMLLPQPVLRPGFSAVLLYQQVQVFAPPAKILAASALLSAAMLSLCLSELLLPCGNHRQPPSVPMGKEEGKEWKQHLSYLKPRFTRPSVNEPVTLVLLIIFCKR